MRSPRQPWTTSRRSPPSLPALVAIAILSLTACAPSDPAPLPTVSPSGPTTPAVRPTPVTTTIVPTPVATTIGPTSSPAATTTVPSTAQWTFVVIRHTNWVDDGSDDPPLTEAGEIRARRLADLLSTRAGVAAYATSHRRAEDTARPTAVVWEVPVTTYDGDLAPAALVSRIKQAHPTGLILIVGHSDTVPGIAGELCRCQVDPIPEHDYSILFEVVHRSDGAVLSSDRVSY